jgi:hypothetical protein
MRKQMTEAQAWEQLYGRRSPDVRVLDQDAPALDAAEEPSRRRAPVLEHERDRPDSAAHAA